MPSAKIQSATLNGITVRPVNISCVALPGEGDIRVLGLKTTDARNLTPRVRCAIRGAGFTLPKETTFEIRVTPEVPHRLTDQLELPCATAILVAARLVDAVPKNACLTGQLTESGLVLPTRGSVCYAKWCAENRFTLACADDATSISHMAINALADLKDNDWKITVKTALRSQNSCLSYQNVRENNDRRIVLLKGPQDAVRATTQLFKWSMQKPAKRQAELLACIYSACRIPFEGAAPFRAPDPSATLLSLVGGGDPIIPGEVSLATYGLLLLEDVERFSDAKITAMASAIEERKAVIWRKDSSYEIPADPALIIATTTDEKAPAHQLLRKLDELLGHTEIQL